VVSKKIVWFKDLTKNDISIAGGKGANLGEMSHVGLPVPPGFCITAQAYFEYINKTGVKAKIMELLSKVDVEDSNNLNEVSKRVKETIISSPMPQDLMDDITDAYRELCKMEGEEVYVAVRSSATAEDLPEASFAGQQETFLDVQGESELIKAVRKCWASLFTPRAIFYREKKGFSHEKVGLSAIVQKMVRSEVSGVMFTVDPTGRTDDLIIEAGYGLGEAIVSGTVTPDTYVIDKQNLEIKSKKISKQERMIVRSEKSMGTTFKEVAPDKKNAQKLPDSKIKELARLGKIVEQHYGFPQDIEWALEEGKLYIVQSRAVTTLGLKEKHKEKNELKGKVIAEGIPASPGIGKGHVEIVHGPEDLYKVKKGDVLVTVMTNPDMVPAMTKAAAIVTDEGGMTSHAAIVSREMGVPCVVGTDKITEIVKDGDNITVDGTNGLVYEGLLEVKQQKVSIEEQFKDLPKTKTKVYMNLGVPDLAEKYAKYPVDGIGLLREEFTIATYVKEHPLKLIEEGRGEVFVEKLVEGIEKVAKAFYPRPVVLRLSDFKTDEYRELEGGEKYEIAEANPMIGWRGCSRYYHPNYKRAFLLEVEAIKRVRQKYENVWVMLPFVRTVDEVKKVEKIFEEQGLKRGPTFKLWLMAEIPSNALIAEEFAEHCDGFSIGSNDLTQLVLGVDRNSDTLGKMGLFNERNLAVKKAIEMIIKGAHAKGKTVSICGQAPSNYPDFTEFLVRNGINSISVNPDAVAKTRRVVAEMERKLGIQPE